MSDIYKNFIISWRLSFWDFSTSRWNAAAWFRQQLKKIIWRIRLFVESKIPNFESRKWGSFLRISSAPSAVTPSSFWFPSSLPSTPYPELPTSQCTGDLRSRDLDTWAVTRIIINSGHREIGLVLAVSIFAKKDQSWPAIYRWPFSLG